MINTIIIYLTELASIELSLAIGNHHSDGISRGSPVVALGEEDGEPNDEERSVGTESNERVSDIPFNIIRGRRRPELLEKENHVHQPQPRQQEESTYKHLLAHTPDLLIVHLCAFS